MTAVTGTVPSTAGHVTSSRTVSAMSVKLATGEKCAIYAVIATVDTLAMAITCTVTRLQGNAPMAVILASMAMHAMLPVAGTVNQKHVI